MSKASIHVYSVPDKRDPVGLQRVACDVSFDDAETLEACFEALVLRLYQMGYSFDRNTEARPSIMFLASRACYDLVHDLEPTDLL